MCRLIETIKCKDGRLYNLPFHQDRFNLARKEIFEITDEISFKGVLAVPPECTTGLFRCRVTYSGTIEKVEFLHHEFRQVRSLKLVNDPKIDYRYKYADRQYLEELFFRRGDCDDILIVKNGCITDSFTANVVFYDGRRWWTPDTPLLAGTQRARLLAEGKISACRITPSGLKVFKKAGLINAMQDLEEMPVIEMDKIKK